VREKVFQNVSLKIDRSLRALKETVTRNYRRINSRREKAIWRLLKRNVVRRGSITKSVD